MDCVSHRILQREGELETPSVEGRVCVCVCALVHVCTCVQCVYMAGRCREGTVSREHRPMCVVPLLPNLVVELRHHSRELELSDSHYLCDPVTLGSYLPSLYLSFPICYHGHNNNIYLIGLF